MLLHRPHEDLRLAVGDPLELLDQPLRLRGRDPAGTAVGHVPRAVDRAEIPAYRYVAGLEREIDPERLQRAAPDPVPERIVAEERQVAGPAAGGDARTDGIVESDLRGPGEIVQVRRARGLQLRRPAGLERQPPEPVEHEQQDLRLGGLDEVGVVLQPRTLTAAHSRSPRLPSTATSGTSSPSLRTTISTVSPGAWDRRASVKA